MGKTLLPPPVRYRIESFRGRSEKEAALEEEGKEQFTRHSLNGNAQAMTH